MLSYLAREDKGPSIQQYYAEAISYYDRAIQLDPKDHLSYEWKATTLNVMGRRTEALAAYDQAIAVNKNDYWCYYCKGTILERLERYHEAYTAYKRAGELAEQQGQDHLYDDAQVKVLGKMSRR